MGRQAQVGARSAVAALVALALIGAVSPAWAQRGPDPQAARLAHEQQERARERFRVDSAAALQQAAADLAKARDVVCMREDRLDALIARLTQDGKTLGQLVELSDAYGQVFSGDNAVRIRQGQVLDAAKSLRAKRCPPPEPKHAAPPPSAPPPPPPAPPRAPAAAAQTRSLTPTHRTAHCVPCQAAARDLNNTADRYADAVRRNDPAEVPLREDMAKLAKALDACERVCHVIAKPPPSRPQINIRPMGSVHY